jgi:hypothetical protein
MVSIYLQIGWALPLLAAGSQFAHESSQFEQPFPRAGRQQFRLLLLGPLDAFITAHFLINQCFFARGNLLVRSMLAGKLAPKSQGRGLVKWRVDHGGPFGWHCSLL